MVKTHSLVFALSVIFILITFLGTAAAQREYHLEHEWAKIWINQNGSIDLLYDISITLDSGPSINYVYVGQPKRDFTIGTAMDQITRCKLTFMSHWWLDKLLDSTSPQTLPA